MARRYLANLFLTLLLSPFTAAQLTLAADEPQRQLNDAAFRPASLAPVYAFGESATGQSVFSGKKAFTIALSRLRSQSNPDTVGMTTYDNQHHCSMGRQVEHRGTGFIHFAWMDQDHDTLGQDRGIGYQALDLDGCSWMFENGGLRIEQNYAGYASIDVDPGGRAVPSGHEMFERSGFHSMTYWEFLSLPVPAGLFFVDYPTDFFGWADNDGTGPDNENIWPKIEWHIGTETVLHMVATESGTEHEFSTISYYRRTGGYGLSAPDSSFGIWTDQRVIDSITNLNVTIASSPVSDRVAIIWSAPADYKRDTPDEFNHQMENDVWYAVSTVQGADWAYLAEDDTVSTGGGYASIGHMVDIGRCEGANITQYSPESDWKAYCDISALITAGDELNIVWGCRRWETTNQVARRQSAIFHWRENTPTVIRPVVFADWDTGGMCYGHAWGSDAAKMTISECDGKLYVLYTQFGSRINPCGDVDEVDHVVNGYLYMSAYDPNLADAWDRSLRITTTPETPNGCAPGDEGNCNSEYWASMSRYGRVDNCLFASENILDILYINDKAPGSCVHTVTGIWTSNPVIWMTVPCRDAVLEPGYIDDAGAGYIDADLIFVPYQGQTTITLAMWNPGTQDNNFVIDTNYFDSSGWIAFNPSSGFLPCCSGDTIAVELTFSHPGGGSCTEILKAEIIVSHDGPTSPRIIPVWMHPLGPGWIDEAILSTACSRLKIFANGRLSNDSPDASFDFIDDCDVYNSETEAEIYLYDGSPIICRIEGDDTLRFTSYMTPFYEDDGLRPTDNLEVDSISNISFTYARNHFMTADTSIELLSEYYFPKHEDSCNFVIKTLSFLNRNEYVLSGVAVGEFLDWDIPSDTNILNGSEYDVARQLIYQRGVEYNDENEDLCPQDQDDRFGGIAVWFGHPFKNLMTIDNATYVYSSGPYGGNAPLPAGAMYSLMTENDGFFTYTSAHPDSEFVDLSTLITYGVFDLLPHDTWCMTSILVNSKSGLVDFLYAFDQAKNFIEIHEILCPVPCECLPADANGDGGHNVADPVYIINYVFKDGPPPIPYTICSGDAQGDCIANVADAVYLINYIFKGGPPPLSCGLWRHMCGIY